MQGATPHQYITLTVDYILCQHYERSAAHTTSSNYIYFQNSSINWTEQLGNEKMVKKKQDEGLPNNVQRHGPRGQFPTIVIISDPS